MAERGIRHRDWLRAEVQEFLSSLTIISPALRRVSEPNLEHVPVYWHHARMTSRKLRNTVTVSGLGAKAGFTPKRYPEAVVIALPRQEIDERQSSHGGQNAVAYALGTTVMVGAKLDRDVFVPEDDEHYLVAMGIGRGTLIASAGLWSIEERQLWIPETPLTVRDRLPADQLPPGIPYV